MADNLPAAAHSLPPPTTEQDLIASHPLLPGQLVLVEAYAGTGKTTTLELVARRHPGRRILYLCFNRANALEARKRMPTNVTSATVHALAYGAIGFRYERKLGEIRAREIMDVMEMRDSRTAQLVQQTIATFLRSDDSEVRSDHVSEYVVLGDKRYVFENARALWKRMIDPNDFSVRLSHDGYLKLWFVSNPVLRQFDLLLVDESQDLEPQTIRLALRQQEAGQAAVIMVGDRHQAIYGWRGATNAMETCAKLARDRYAITESFRFPPSHADAAAYLLKTMKETTAPLVGRGAGLWSAARSRAFLARTNASLIMRAMDVKGPLHFAATDKRTGYSPFIPYRFQEILDVLSLMKGENWQVRTPHLKRFKSYAEMREFASSDGLGATGDVELQSLMRLVEQYSDGLPSIIESIVKRSGPLTDQAMSFSSAHRSKGLEWDLVVIHDDFLPIHDQAELKKIRVKLTPRQFAEEVNLLYVALTRARCRLDLPPGLRQWFAVAGIELPQPPIPTVPVPTAPAVQRVEKPQPPRRIVQNAGQGEFAFI